MLQLQHVHPGDNWVNGFSSDKQGTNLDFRVDGSEFLESKWQDWVDDFGNRVSKGVLDEDGGTWLDTYDK